MNPLKPKSVLGTVALFFLVLMVCQSGIFNQHYNNAEAAPAEKALYPNDWMYSQRAYPNNFINREALQKAAIQIEAIKNSYNKTAGSEWELVGPLNTGGRITDVAISPDSDDILYVGTATGGVFKTTDAGASWTPIFDEISKPSIGDLAIAPSNSQRIYVGTGEANGSATDGAYFGNGIYRSDNAGATWSHIGLEQSDHIGRIAVDPTNPDRVFVAASGKLYGYNPERGIYRTTNGGTTWEQVLFVTDSTAAIDVVMNPQNTNILFAALWERTRKPWQRDYGGVTSAIHRSLDGGNTWTELGAAQGLPAPDAQTGRIGLAISKSNPSTIYARYTTNEITNEFNGLYRSDDNGNTWSLVTLNDLIGVDSSFGWYFGNLRVNPTDPDEVYILGQLIQKTTDGGANWQNINGMHVDHHALEYSENNPDFILAGNDGGAYVSQNGGNSWNKFTNLPITQFYNIEVDYLQPERLYGGTQDNNTIRTLSGGTSDWNSIIGGDGFHVNVDPSDNNYVYGESQFGALRRSTDGGNNFSNGTNGIDGSDRVNWNTPVVLSPFNPEKMFYGSNRLYTSDRAVSWTPISPDLTDGLHPSGSLSYGTLTAIAASYLNLNTIYVGSDDGNVQVTFDGGASWTNISNGLPDRYITSIAISPSNDLIAYVTLSGFGVLDYDPHVFKTIDGGQNWMDISSNLPSIPANDIILNSNEDVLFLATDLAVWYSLNDGGSWELLGTNLPMTVIRDLKLHEPTNMLYAGTFGRSMHRYDLSGIVLGTDNFTVKPEEIIVFPNPAKDHFTIKHSMAGRGTIKLFHSNGTAIGTLFEDDFGTHTQIEGSSIGLESGLYFLVFESGKQKISKKLIIL
ncbi:MAG TPA: T9SS type A sorting domain-containing protein [Flavobacteriaceae bacterium]|nr:T9SS type A sorting domain-containing protein [Flavobacteriaceae bacterium]HPF10696.1 T9SS type A sorting domain-containing protein [Flavobacteriaceae bacterium]HQU21959.1 T9SS type A sorting domain-containing protein [Flavobacteriaceae bacterium]HRW43189.1 T9SS type A sorting domain-containing protein [Flavobacteriaceae bacterium]